jgi:HAD superfamily hydrolase (TIGR01509 family)
MSKQFGVIWDLDGVLVDTGEFHYQSWRRTFADLKIELSRDQFRATFGMNNAGILEEILGYKPESNFVEKISDQKEGHFRRTVRGRVKPLPGVLEWLRQLEDMGAHQAIASSAPQANIDALVDELQLREFFEVIVSGYDMPGKPNPDVFLRAADLMEVPAPNCLVIEDSVSGVRAAKNAGMRCIAVTTTNPAHLLSEADIVVDRLDVHPAETVLNLIEDLLKNEDS